MNFNAPVRLAYSSWTVYQSLCLSVRLKTKHIIGPDRMSVHEPVHNSYQMWCVLKWCSGIIQTEILHFSVIKTMFYLHLVSRFYIQQTLYMWTVRHIFIACCKIFFIWSLKCFIILQNYNFIMTFVFLLLVNINWPDANGLEFGSILPPKNWHKKGVCKLLSD